MRNEATTGSLIDAELTQSVAKAFTLTIAPREDGGLRVFIQRLTPGYSDDMPGLILSGYDRDKVLMDIGPALKVLLDWPFIPAPTPAPDGGTT